jgi:hypothetical protein
MAIYLDELFARGEELDWAIVGAGVRPANVAMREKLEAQDWLTTVVELRRSWRTLRSSAISVQMSGSPPPSPIGWVSCSGRVSGKRFRRTPHEREAPTGAGIRSRRAS